MHDAVPLAKTDPKVKQTPSFTNAELYNLTRHFFDQFIYPANLKQSASVNSTLFSEDVLGRVDVTRTFVGRGKCGMTVRGRLTLTQHLTELNTEYFFGLFSTLATSKQFSLLGVPVSYDFSHFAAQQNIVSVAMIANFYLAALNITVPVEIDVWVSIFVRLASHKTNLSKATWNSLGQMSQYDATFRYFQYTEEFLLGTAGQALGLNSTATIVYLSQALAQSICGTAQTYCTGANQIYNSTSECENFMLSIPFGLTYQLGMNTLQCRMVHQPMVPFRPDVHCPHLSRGGGGYCTNDLTYEGVVLQPFFTNTPFVPKAFLTNATMASL